MQLICNLTLWCYTPMGIFELDTREYTLDEESSDDEKEGEGEDSEGERAKGKEKKARRREVEDNEEEPEGVTETNAKRGAPSEALEAESPSTMYDDLRAQATALMGVAKRDVTRSAEDVISTPAPGEMLAAFCARSCEYWAQKAHQEHASDNRVEYKQILEEVEKILAEAELDEDEMQMQATRDSGIGTGQSRNRR
ncbi:hypothetical protein JVU11DRAFT_3268 [Chiua virens]|nr:hypothetical protein JVU11DRAFT_3268 [Chiua virens]